MAIGHYWCSEERDSQQHRTGQLGCKREAAAVGWGVSGEDGPEGQSRQGEFEDGDQHAMAVKAGSGDE